MGLRTRLPPHQHRHSVGKTAGSHHVLWARIHTGKHSETRSIEYTVVHMRITTNTLRLLVRLRPHRVPMLKERRAIHRPRPEKSRKRHRQPVSYTHLTLPTIYSV